MNLEMRLFKRGKVFYAELERNRKVSLKTEDKTEAARLYRSLRKKYLNNRLAVLEGRPAARTLADFTGEYLEYSGNTKAPDTYRADKLALGKLLDYLGDQTAMSAITPQLLDRWLADLTRGVKKTSANVYLRHVKAALSKALEWGYIKAHPGKGVKPLKAQEAPPRYLDKTEAAQLLAAEDDLRYKKLWLFFLLTGCRRSEALQLSARDVDRGAGCITIPRTKNRKARLIWLTPELETLICQLPEIGLWWPWNKDFISHRFQEVAARAGVKARLHDLRHTYASHKAMAGVDLYTLKELLGHRDIKATQIYSHLSAAHLKDAAKKGTVGGE
ncbi:MAG: tyrosine-type recombinase/integrase [Desulfobaccales bacterium]